MFYCSLCGCAAASHEVTQDWKKSEKTKAKNEKARRAESERRQHQQHKSAENKQKLRSSEVEAFRMFGLEPSASQKQIRSAYRKLALKCVILMHGLIDNLLVCHANQICACTHS